MQLLRRGVDVVIGTPGRLKDMLQGGGLSLAGVRWLVLDEADRMLDMGFEDDMRAIVGQVPRSRQTMLFTATWSRSVERLAAEFCPAPVSMSVGERGAVLAANVAITQHVELLSGVSAKTNRLASLFDKLFCGSAAGGSGEAAAPAAAAAPARAPLPDHGKVIVFVKFKAACDRIAQTLWDAGFFVDTLHGDMDQVARSRVIAQFRTGKLRVIVATDVAARGLDVPYVTTVVNFDFPFGKAGAEDYVHRIGRTGRAGATGTSYTFFDPAEDRKNAPSLVAVLKGAKQAVPEALAALCYGGGGGRASSGGRGGYGSGGGGGRHGGSHGRHW